MLARGIALVLSILAQSVGGDSIVETGDWLSWAAPAAGSCGDRAGFAGEVERRLGRPPGAAADGLGLSIAVRVERVVDPAPRWLGELRVRTRDGAPEGVRTIERTDDTCAPITTTLALMVALVLQPSAPAAPPAAAPPPAAPPPPAPRAVDAEPAEPTPDDHKSGAGRGPATLTLTAGPGASLGLQPGVALLGEASAIVRPFGGLGLFATFVLSAPSSAFVGPNNGATLSRAGLDLGVCAPDLLWSSRALELCAGGEIGRLRAFGFGLTTNGEQNLWAFAATAGAHLRQRIDGPLFVAAGIRLVVPLERDRIAYAGPAGVPIQIYQASPVGGSGELLIGVVLP
jgi:hypothetical protein